MKKQILMIAIFSLMIGGCCATTHPVTKEDMRAVVAQEMQKNLQQRNLAHYEELAECRDARREALPNPGQSLKLVRGETVDLSAITNLAEYAVAGISSPTDKKGELHRTFVVPDIGYVNCPAEIQCEMQLITGLVADPLDDLQCLDKQRCWKLVPAPVEKPASTKVGDPIQKGTIDFIRGGS